MCNQPSISHFNTNWLETGQDNRLEETRQQLPDGNGICSHRGCLYIVDNEVMVYLYTNVHLTLFIPISALFYANTMFF